MHSLFETYPKARTIFFLRCDSSDEQNYELLRPYDDSEVETFEVLYVVPRQYRINEIESPRVLPKLAPGEKKKIYRLDKLAELLTILPLDRFKSSSSTFKCEVVREPKSSTEYRF